MIKRIWRGWTTPDDADRYETLLRNEIFSGIEAKEMPGYQGIDLLRRDLQDEVEFITIMTFASLEDVIGFQGEDYARAYVPESARRLLSRWDDVSRHYEVREQKKYVR